MQDWWLHNGPPVYMAVAGYLGLIKPPSKGTVGAGEATNKYSNLEELERMFASTGGHIQ